MSARPDLRLVNAEGEIVQDDPLVLEHEELKRKFFGLLGENGKLKRQIAELHAVEPDAELVQEALDYWRERCKPRAAIAVGDRRWAKARARLREKLDNRPPLTVQELKLAVDGALLDRWHTQKGMAHRLDAEYLFRDHVSVEKLRDLALGFKATAGIDLGDLLDVMDELRFLDWKFLLRTCFCEHKRFEHSKADPNREGREVCLAAGCDCMDFDMDPLDPFNLRVDGHLQRFFGKGAV